MELLIPNWNIYDYVSLWANSNRLEGSSLKCGEVKEGELVFEVPDELLQSGEPLYVVIIRGYQMVVFQLN